MFYVLSTDGIIAQLTAVSYVWIAYNTQVIGMDHSDWIEDWMLQALIMILLYNARKVRGSTSCL